MAFCLVFTILCTFYLIQNLRYNYRKARRVAVVAAVLHNICLDWGEEDIREEDEGHNEEDEGHGEEGLYEQEEIEGT